ncbi:MurR/RpiR family transcriptional regulator [Pseudooceanicola sp. CBS1P-1]|uniref:SIS domain-containing protein n=1 Tax=Pseudooceanicola albus TaxID=2692189 RepID=A0A6L7GAS2_9RHOB|nr:MULTISPECIES: MurR/RpiR family transcriptional regulator [Pseudooceanicola]MBT9386996.1 MurR/RpiR family transcriptional regulator [Pseudooceanicola endophyticus]MXN21151.1 SIS domain-containing protein [Pseudooceanicola albus]
MDPTLRNRTLATLKDEIPDLPRGLRTVAKYVVDHPSDFGLDPIRETARKAGVSTYTLVRLAERLGFGGYDEMREPFRQALVSAAVVVEKPAWVEGLRDAGEMGRIQAEASLNAMSIVQRTLEQQDVAQMARVVGLLMQAPTVYLTAVRASYALAYYLHYVGRMALPSLQLIPRHMNSPVDELHDAQPGDVLIALTFTPYSRETIEACKLARRKGVKLVMISDSEIVAPDFSADETLIASVLSTHHFGCYAGVMALIETLLAQLVATRGEAARERINSYEAMRAESQAYWAAQKKR